MINLLISKSFKIFKNESLLFNETLKIKFFKLKIKLKEFSNQTHSQLDTIFDCYGWTTLIESYETLKRY